VVAAGEPRIVALNFFSFSSFSLAQARPVAEALNSGDTQQKDAGCLLALRAPTAAALSLCSSYLESSVTVTLRSTAGARPHARTSQGSKRT
jgi:hypothetical protein